MRGLKSIINEFFAANGVVVVLEAPFDETELDEQTENSGNITEQPAAHGKKQTTKPIAQ